MDEKQKWEEKYETYKMTLKDATEETIEQEWRSKQADYARRLAAIIDTSSEEYRKLLSKQRQDEKEYKNLSKKYEVIAGNLPEVEKIKNHRDRRQELLKELLARQAKRTELDEKNKQLDDELKDIKETQGYCNNALNNPNATKEQKEHAARVLEEYNKKFEQNQEQFSVVQAELRKELEMSKWDTSKEIIELLNKQIDTDNKICEQLLDGKTMEEINLDIPKKTEEEVKTGSKIMIMLNEKQKENKKEGQGRQEQQAHSNLEPELWETLINQEREQQEGTWVENWAKEEQDVKKEQAQQSAEQQAQQPTQQQAQQQAKQQAQQQAKQQAQQPTQQPTQQPAEQPDEKPSEKSAEDEEIKKQEENTKGLAKRIDDNMRYKLNSIYCTFENGYREYVISYNDIDGVEKSSRIPCEENKYITKKGKEMFTDSMNSKDKRTLNLIDANAIYALISLDRKIGQQDKEIINEIYGPNSQNARVLFNHQYTNFLRDIIGKDKQKSENDIKITYDLSNIKNSNLSLADRFTFRWKVLNSKRLGIADYIPAPNKIKEFFKKMTTKKLQAGKTEKIHTTEEIIKDLGNEPGFNINEFIEQQEKRMGRPISLEEQKNIVKQHMQAQSKEAETQTLRDRVKYDVSANRNKQTRKNEEERQTVSRNDVERVD